MNDVSGPNACCQLCKEDPNCMNFSYGKLKDGGYSKQCYLKRGGTLSSRHEFTSSPQNIEKCACGKGMLRFCLEWFSNLSFSDICNSANRITLD